MSAEKSRPTAERPQAPVQFSQLRTLLLVFVVLGASLVVFGAWWIALLLPPVVVSQPAAAR